MASQYIHLPAIQAEFVVTSPIEVIISQTNDSIRIGDGTNLVTATQVGGKTGLDVNLINATIEVAIDAATDSIRISDGTDTLAINPDGSINVDITTPGTEKNIYNEVTSVPQGVLTSVCSYTVPLGKSAKLLRSEFSGTNIAKYSILLNGSTIDQKYTNFGAPLNERAEFTEGLPLTTGDALIVKVLHNRPYLGNFNARILVIEV